MEILFYFIFLRGGISVNLLTFRWILLFKLDRVLSKNKYDFFPWSPCFWSYLCY